MGDAGNLDARSSVKFLAGSCMSAYVVGGAGWADSNVTRYMMLYAKDDRLLQLNVTCIHRAKCDPYSM